MEKTIQKTTLTWAGFFITLTGAVLFSTKAIIVKKAFAHAAVDPVTLLTLRMAFALPFYLAAAFFISGRSENVRMTKKQWTYTLLLGFIGYYLSSLFDFLGLQYITAGLERLILFLYPTFAVLLNRFFFKQKLLLNQKIALLLTYLGIGLAFFGELKLDQQNPAFYWGSFLVFLCAFTYSFYLVGSTRLIHQVGSNKFTAYAMLAASLGVFVHFAFKGNYAQLTGDASLWTYGILLAIVATVIPSFLLSNGLKRIGTNNAAIISSIGPVSTIIQAHYFLGEQFSIMQLIGTVLVVAGILLLGWKRIDG